MASGAFYLENDTNLRCKVVWSSSGNRVTATLYAKKINATAGTTGTWSWWCTIGSSSNSGSVWLFINTDYVEVASFSATVSGSTAYIYGKVSAPSGTLLAGQSSAGSDTVTITDTETDTEDPDPEPEEPEASTIVTASDCYFGDVCYVTWVPPDSGYYFKLKFTCGTRSKEYISISSQSAELMRIGRNVPYDFINEVTSGLRKNVTVALSTHTQLACTDSSQIGEASTATISCTVPDNENTRPTVTGMTLTPRPNPFSGAYIQNKTGVKVSNIQSSGKYGATIASTYFRVSGKKYGSAESFTSDEIPQYGTVTVTAYAVDSRGFTSEGYAKSINVISYSTPKLRPIEGQRRVTADRCDGEGTRDDDGAYLIIKAKREYSPVLFNSVQKNFCRIRYRYKPDTSTAWSGWTLILAADAASDEVTTAPLIGTLAAKSTYQVEIQAIDTLNSSVSTILTVSSDRIFDHADGARGSYGFGKFAEADDVFDIAADKTLILRGGMLLMGESYLYLLDLMHPVGSILESVNNADPGDTLGGTWVLMETTDTTTKWRRSE